MIEIILLFFLSKKIGELAEQKGFSSTRWIIITVLAWIVAEMFGIIVALMFFAKENIVSILLVAILFGVASYHLIRSFLQKLPDRNNESK